MDELCTKNHAAICNALGLDDGTSFPTIKNTLIEYTQAFGGSGITMDGKDDAAEELSTMYQIYFDYCMAWHKYLGTSGGQPPSHADALKPKTEAGINAKSMQKVITRLAWCEAFLELAKKEVEQDIEAAVEKAPEAHKEIQWTYDLPPQVALMTKRRRVLSDYMVKIRRVKPIVEKMEHVFLALDKALSALLGDRKAKKIMDELTGHLRQREFAEAKEYLSHCHKADLKNIFRLNRKSRKKRWTMVLEMADAIILCVDKKSAALIGRGGRLFLRQWEVDIAYDSMLKELEDARNFLEKYEVPEIRYRRDALDRQGTSLKNIATLPDFLDLYEELLKGQFFALRTAKDVRAFEEGALKKAAFADRTVVTELEQIETAIMKLARAPETEDIPDDKLFENMEDIPALAASG